MPMTAGRACRVVGGHSAGPFLGGKMKKIADALTTAP